MLRTDLLAGVAAVGQMLEELSVGKLLSDILRSGGSRESVINPQIILTKFAALEQWRNRASGAALTVADILGLSTLFNEKFWAQFLGKEGGEIGRAHV